MISLCKQRSSTQLNGDHGPPGQIHILFKDSHFKRETIKGKKFLICIKKNCKDTGDICPMTQGTTGRYDNYAPLVDPSRLILGRGAAYLVLFQITKLWTLERFREVEDFCLKEFSNLKLPDYTINYYMAQKFHQQNRINRDYLITSQGSYTQGLYGLD